MHIKHMLYTALLVALLARCQAFAPLGFALKLQPRSATSPLTVLAAEENDPVGEESSSSYAKTTLEEKMKSWEATEEEVKAATLGGVVPRGGNGAGRSDAFDVGLYILFPFMVLSGLAFAVFPFIMGNLDLDSIGPPPTV